MYRILRNARWITDNFILSPFRFLLHDSNNNSNGARNTSISNIRNDNPGSRITRSNADLRILVTNSPSRYTEDEEYDNQIQQVDFSEVVDDHVAEKPPNYDSIINNRPPDYNQTLAESLADISQVMVENMRVGSYKDYFIACSICCLFQILGVIYVTFFTKSHAHRFGMMAAVGLTLFLLSSLVPLQQQHQQQRRLSIYGDALRHSSQDYLYDEYEGSWDYSRGRESGIYDHQSFSYNPRGMELNRAYQLFVSISSLLGYLLLIYSLLAYRQMRSSARQMILMASTTV